MSPDAAWMYEFLDRFGPTTGDALRRFSLADRGKEIDPFWVALDINAEREPLGEVVTWRHQRREGMDPRKIGNRAWTRLYSLNSCPASLTEKEAYRIMRSLREPSDWFDALQLVRRDQGYFKGQTLQVVDRLRLIDRAAGRVPEPVWRAFRRYCATHMGWERMEELLHHPGIDEPLETALK